MATLIILQMILMIKFLILVLCLLVLVLMISCSWDWASAPVHDSTRPGFVPSEGFWGER